MTSKTTPMVYLDFETRSAAPFGKQKDSVSGFQYANHPTTGIWCMCWAVGDGPVQTWTPEMGPGPVRELFRFVKAGGVVSAHNAGFEYNIWNFLLPRYLPETPFLKFENMDCTAARAAAMAIPRSLDGACKAMNVAFQKDEEGSRLMQRMAKPRKVLDDGELIWWDDTERVARLVKYCIADVEAERALDAVLRHLSDDEWETWQLDHRTNMRGVRVDVDFARRAERIMDEMQDRYAREIASVTGHSVCEPTEVGALKTWLNDRGHEVSSVDKVTVESLLASQAVKDDPQSHRALQIRQEAGKSSVAKLSRFISLSHSDERMRENFLYHGAATGRLAGKGAQLQNLPSRGGLHWRVAEALIDFVKQTDNPRVAADYIELMHGSVPSALSSCLRGCITATPGKELFVADYSNIEGRIAAWYGGEQWKLDAFRQYDAGTGPDLYKVTAGQILGISPAEVSKSQRNVMGKVPELALGFEGGVGAFQSMANIYGVDMAEYWPTIQTALSDEFVQKAHGNWDLFGKKSGMFIDAWLASETVKLAWRARHPGIRKCWYDAGDCAVKALRNPGTFFEFADGKCALGATSIGGVPFLIGRLPSGRKIYFADARIDIEERGGKRKATVSYMGVDSITRQWVRFKTYGGDLFQSFVQAGARDLMVNGWKNVEYAGFEVVLSVHDEVGAEGDPSRTVEEFCELMETLPAWADGCPVSAEGYKAFRYRKDGD